jgi:hypothetical protein
MCSMRCAACNFDVSPGAINYGTRPTPPPAHGSTNAAPGIGAGASLTAADVYAAAKRAQQIANAHALQNAYSRLASVGVPVFAAGQLAQPHPLAHLGAAEPPKPLPTAGITVGELIGWRIWKVRPTDRLLESYSAERIWLPGEPMEGQPDDHGGAGVWAFKEAYRAAVKSQECFSALGTVWLWGNVIEHAEGYRAEFAEIRSIDHVACNSTAHLPSSDATWCEPEEMLIFSASNKDTSNGHMKISLRTDRLLLAALRQRYGVDSAEDAETQKKSGGPG